MNVSKVYEDGMQPFGPKVWISGGLKWLKYEKNEKLWLSHIDLNT